MIEDQNIARPIRIEILQSLDNPNIFRPRVWVKNTYNVYPTTVNTGPKGEDLRSMHSSDDFNNDISNILAEDESFFVGKYYDNEDQVLQYAINRVKFFYKK